MRNKFQTLDMADELARLRELNERLRKENASLLWALKQAFDHGDLSDSPGLYSMVKAAIRAAEGEK